MVLVTQLIILYLIQIGLAQNKNPQVTTPLGKILGSILTTRLNKTIYAFRGISYAQPPINELRFQPPVPIDPWSGVYNATVDGPVCPQPSDDPISEDCLVLNVYTTKLPEDGTNPKRPVIIYLHAGGFYSVTGRSNWGGPQYWLDQDIVLVTINYRLGSLGFISTGKDAPGNNGLRDQVLAMRWVKDNIEAFGGDPASVTLYGYSAGAWSITLHIVSPMSRGLFHRAIIGSGSTLGQWPLPTNQLELAQKQARFVGCPESSPKQILDCLKTVPAEDLGNSLEKFAEFGYEPVIIWSPVIEEDYGQERFLPEHPIKMIQDGNFMKIPIVIGVTQDEFANRAFPIIANATLLKELDDEFETYAPICFLYERETNKSRQVSAAVRTYYFSDAPLTNGSLSGLTKAFADSVTGFPTNRAVNLLTEYNTEPVYYYEFTYQGRYSHFYLPDSNGTEPYGVVHHDDLIYLFYISAIFPFFDETYPEGEMVEKLGSLWANFAKTGNPIPKSSVLFDGIEWERYNVSTRKYLDIGKEIVLRERLYEGRYRFWDTLYPMSAQFNKH